MRRNRKLGFLIGDDEPDTCWALEHVLRRVGASCDRALNATEALSRFGERTFSLVLLDAKLPDMDGLELAQQLQRMNPHVPILLVSGYYGRDDSAIHEATATGLIQGFIEKPFLHDEILLAVREILAPSPGTRESLPT